MASERDTLIRQWELLQNLPREPRSITPRELLDRLKGRFTMSLRTIQRDLTMLSGVFPITQDDAAGPHGARWYWTAEGQALSIPAMGSSEALALLMSREHLQTSLPEGPFEAMQPYFASADRVLARPHTRALAGWRNKIHEVPRGPLLSVPAVDPQIQRTIYEAVLNGRQLRAAYTPRWDDGKRKDYILHPLGLVLRDGVIYLVAMMDLYEDPYHYALHRFNAVEALPDAARVLPGFELARHATRAFGMPLSEAAIDLELAVDVDVSRHLTERRLSDGQTMTPRRDGRIRLQATVADTQELRWWLLGFGSGVEVTRPRSLRNEMRELTAEAAALYSKSTKA